MTRPLRAPRRDEVPEEEREAYDQVVGRQRTPGRSAPDDAEGRPQLSPYHAGPAR